MMFETLAYIDRLKQAGIDDAAARAHAEALRTALGETVATKEDLKDVRAEISDVRVSLQAEIKDVRAEIKDSATRLDHKIDLVARDQTIKLYVTIGSATVVMLSAMAALKLFVH